MRLSAGCPKSLDLVKRLCVAGFSTTLRGGAKDLSMEGAEETKTTSTHLQTV